jgi:rRNA maturation protein Nop10
MDYLEVLEKNSALKPDSLSPEDNYRVYRFHELVSQIRKARNE